MLHRLLVPIVVALAATTPLSAHPGVGIVIDVRGNVYYTDLKQVWRITPDGTKSVVVPHVHTHELCLDAEGNLYGEHLWYEGERTDKWGHRVWRLSPDGTLVDVVPAREGFHAEFSFVRDREWNEYWIDHSPGMVFRQRSPDGTVTTLAESSVGLRVGWMTCTSEGDVLFSDGSDLRVASRQKGIRTLARNLKERRFGQFQVGDHHALMGVWSDSARNAYVAVYSGRMVKRVSPEGNVDVVARSCWPWSPTGGLVAPDGSLWLLESSFTNAVRVRRVASNECDRTF